MPTPMPRKHSPECSYHYYVKYYPNKARKSCNCGAEDWNLAHDAWTSWIKERLEEMFQKAGKSRPIKNKQGEITSLIIIDLKDFNDLFTEINKGENG